ncbi:hypothetical protein [Enterococcus lemanii]|uniref:Addiction module toxin RelE n=1 Tax=Enterococcus lemanii TaxID=1159752 RepID=A0ABV9MUA8_9ENTE|nr:hypothetical protein [Enterococcus lemanii]MBM7709504.1 hypothetical protein [Enterococcus lemanii]
MKKIWDKRKIKDFIMNEATEKDMIELIEIMRAKKNLLDLEKIAKQKEKIVKDVNKLF